MKNNYYLVTYDIAMDNTRNRISKRLKYEGLDRIQYSVYWGYLKTKQKAELQSWLSLTNTFAANDSLIITSCNKARLESSFYLGRELETMSDWLNPTGIIFI